MFNSFDNRISDIEKMISEAFSPEEQKAYLNSLRVKFMSAEQREKYNQISAEQAKPKDEQNKEKIDALHAELGIKK